MLAAALDHLGMARGRGVALLQQLGVADDRGERGAQVVADAGEEVGLGPVGGVGAQHGLVELLLALGERGDGAAVPGGFEDQREVALDDPAEQGQLAVDGDRVGVFFPVEQAYGAEGFAVGPQ